MAKKMHAIIRLTIYNNYDPDARGFGRGVVMLLDNIEKTGSIKKAARSMGMAYSKAWKVLTEVEEEFGIQLLEREGHRGSSISPDALALLEAYRSVLQEITETTDSAFNRYFKELQTKPR